MKLRALLTWIVLCISLPGVAGPIYRAGEQDSFSWTDLLHGEVSLDYTFSSLKLQDYLGDYSSDRLHGFSGRVLWQPVGWLGVGMEGGRFHETSLPETMVNSYKVSRLGAVAKLTFTPNTNPRLYLLAGRGRTTHELHFRSWIGNSWAPVKKTVSYWTLGLGVETSLWTHFFAGVEADLLWHQNTQLWRLHKTTDHVETAVRLRAGVQF